MTNGAEASKLGFHIFVDPATREEQQYSAQTERSIKKKLIVFLSIARDSLSQNSILSLVESSSLLETCESFC